MSFGALTIQTFLNAVNSWAVDSQEMREMSVAAVVHSGQCYSAVSVRPGNFVSPTI